MPYKPHAIRGVKPLVNLNDGEDREVKSATSSSSYTVKRVFDHYSCTCPAWRNQKGVAVNARSCKHLQSLLGDKYEENRVAKAKWLASKDDGPSSSSKPDSKSTSKTTGKRKKPESDEDEDNEEEDKDSEEQSDSDKKGKGKSKAKKPKLEVQDEEVKDEDKDESMSDAAASETESDGEDDKEDSTSTSTSGDSAKDELAEIDGIKPDVYMADGDEKEVKSLSSSSVYKVKRTWDHYYCTCPAWRNQGGVPVNARTCKHLKNLLGDKYEAARVKLKNPNGPPPTTSKAAKGKAADGTSGKKAIAVLLANKWDLGDGPDPTGWWMSEKLDGVRTFYDGKERKMYSRLGNPFTPPDWFLDNIPKSFKGTLDGELFGGRGEFQSTVSIVKTINSPHWKGITFQIFDIPSLAEKPFEERVEKLESMFGEDGKHKSDKIVIVKHEEVKDRQHVLDKLREIEALGGEGLMLRRPGSQYEGARSSSLLKVKTFYDAEAEVTGYMDGKGKHKGVTGALKCKMESGKTFNVGSGLTDKQRQKPPKVGTIITYRFQELTKDGVPRFPTFVGEAVDKDSAKDAEVPPHRKTNAKSSD